MYKIKVTILEPTLVSTSPGAEGGCSSTVHSTLLFNGPSLKEKIVNSANQACIHLLQRKVRYLKLGLSCHAMPTYFGWFRRPSPACALLSSPASSSLLCSRRPPARTPRPPLLLLILVFVSRPSRASLLPSPPFLLSFVLGGRPLFLAGRVWLRREGDAASSLPLLSLAYARRTPPPPQPCSFSLVFGLLLPRVALFPHYLCV